MEQPDTGRTKREETAEALNSEEKQDAATEESPVAIVGIGASAGGLEALEAFFARVPPETGIAFVVVTHQAPNQPSSLPDILQKSTALPVVPIEDGMRLRPDTVYVTPPNADLSILHGTFTMLEPTLHRGVRLPIDAFFRDLAEDQEDRAIGVVLSGMGSDGTLGVRALKEHLGMVMVQDPATTRYDSMPQAALATGLVDYRAPADELPALLVDYVQHKSGILQEFYTPTEKMENALARIFVLIRSRTGQDFTYYKRSTIVRRIERRMGLHQLERIEDYIRYLRESPDEVDILAKDLRIGVTRFFRDPEAWKTLQEKILPDLISSRPHGGTLRVWVAGCSTGEEAYSMAIALHEVLDTLQRGGELRLQVFATDVDADAIETARSGRYPPNIAVDVSPERLERFFVQEDGSYRVRQEIRESVVFAVQNVISDPPFTRLDVLSCRNLLIYLSPEIQRRLIPLFHYALVPGGVLFLGSAETIGGYSDLFSPADAKSRLFFASPEAGALRQIGVLRESHLPAESGGARDRQPLKANPVSTLTQQKLLEYYAPPTVILTENGDIVHVYGRTGKYLELPPGRADLNISAMAREGLRYQITAAIRTAVHKKTDVTVENVVVGTNGGSQKIRLVVRPIQRPPGMGDLLMATFEEIEEEQRGPADAAVGTDLMDAGQREIEQEYARCRRDLQNMMEEMQTSQEEMKSMNEELQSTNEELQSTNEELTTSKEELQSVNEELLTVNAELQTKIAELTRTTDDFVTLLKSTEIGMIFLDTDLRVRRFTEPATRIVNLIPSDIGRPVTDLVTNIINGNSIQKDAREVLDTLMAREKQVQTTSGAWYLMRILPYRTADNRIDGAAITFVEITEIKHLERSLQETRAYAENIIDTIREALVVLDTDIRVVSANRAFYEAFRTTPEETEGRLLYTLGNNQWDIPELRHLLEEILPNRTQMEGFVVEHTFPGIGRRVMNLNARKMRADTTSGELILLAIEDITDVRTPSSDRV